MENRINCPECGRGPYVASGGGLAAHQKKHHAKSDLSVKDLRVMTPAQGIRTGEVNLIIKLMSARDALDSAIDALAATVRVG